VVGRGGTTTAVQRRETDSWAGRLANELYLGAVVLAGLAVVGALIAALFGVVLEVSDWIAMAD
jgi:uncharacterized membrane protein